MAAIVTVMEVRSWRMGGALGFASFLLFSCQCGFSGCVICLEIITVDAFILSPGTLMI